MPRAEGPYKVVSKVNDNAYKIELPGDYGVHATFNVGDLSPYVDDDGIAELRTIPFKGGGDDTVMDGSSIEELVINVDDGSKGTHGARLATQAKFIGESVINHVCVLSGAIDMTG